MVALDLGPEARKLIEAGRGAMRPTVADRERIAALLRARRGLPLEPAASPASALAWPVISAVVLGLGSVGVFVGVAALQPAAEPAVAQPAAPAVSVGHALPDARAAAVVTPAAPPRSLPVADPVRPSSDKPPQLAKPPVDRLAEEVEILSRAQTELQSGRFSEALKLSAEHGRSFPRGMLAPERRSLRIQALCALGRVAEAEAELARLPAGSLHESRAREACAGRLP